MRPRLPRVVADHPPTAGPIWALIDAAPNALWAIAPERATDLGALLNSLVIRFPDDESFIACKLFGEKTIVVSRGFVEAIWLATWSQLVTEDTLSKQAAAGEPLVLNEEDPRVALALDALRRVVALAVETTPIDWTGLPSPVPPGKVDEASPVEAKCLVSLVFPLRSYGYPNSRARFSSSHPRNSRRSTPAGFRVDLVEFGRIGLVKIAGPGQ